MSNAYSSRRLTLNSHLIPTSLRYVISQKNPSARCLTRTITRRIYLSSIGQACWSMTCTTLIRRQDLSGFSERTGILCRLVWVFIFENCVGERPCPCRHSASVPSPRICFSRVFCYCPLSQHNCVHYVPIIFSAWPNIYVRVDDRRLLCLTLNYAALCAMLLQQRAASSLCFMVFDASSHWLQIC